MAAAVAERHDTSNNCAAVGVGACVCCFALNPWWGVHHADDIWPLRAAVCSRTFAGMYFSWFLYFWCIIMIQASKQADEMCKVTAARAVRMMMIQHNNNNKSITAPPRALLHHSTNLHVYFHYK